MIVRVNISIDNEPGDNNAYGHGNLNFSEQAQFASAGFETVSKIFTRCHELLEVLKHEHAIQARGPRA